MMGGLGMMGNPAMTQAQALMQSMMALGMRQGLDMSNPVIAQLMMQQVIKTCFLSWNNE